MTKIRSMRYEMKSLRVRWLTISFIEVPFLPLLPCCLSGDEEIANRIRNCSLSICLSGGNFSSLRRNTTLINIKSSGRLLKDEQDHVQSNI